MHLTKLEMLAFLYVKCGPKNPLFDSSPDPNGKAFFVCILALKYISQSLVLPRTQNTGGTSV